MVESAESLWERALELALDSKHPAYDMMFVTLAEQLGAPLITNDQKLAKLFPSIVLSPEAALALDA